MGRPPTKPTNRFARWFDGAGMHVDDIAAALGVKKACVYNYRSGYRKPQREIAVKIADLTDGKVSVRSWDQKPLKVKP